MSTRMSEGEQARQLAHQVLDRARHDDDFLQHLLHEPVETLQSAGFSLDGARNFSQEFPTGEVAGYLPRRQPYCNYTCDAITCIVTWCGAVPFSN